MGGEFVAWTADGTSLFLDGAPLGSPGTPCCSRIFDLFVAQSCNVREIFRSALGFLVANELVATNEVDGSPFEIHGLSRIPNLIEADSGDFGQHVDPARRLPYLI